jgi:prepilin-type N-terminal cleavage/methylation domain-containing protein
MKKGFTIIEIVLVLAIASLIFLMVFLALPALQRAQRDNDRRRDVGLVVAAIQSFYANNRGKALEAEDGRTLSCTPAQQAAGDTECRDAEGNQWYSALNSTQLGPYLGPGEGTSSNPNGVLSSSSTFVGIYLVSKYGGNYNNSYRIGTTDKAGHISVTVGVTCPTEGYNEATDTATLPFGNRKNAAVIVVLENGGYYCQNV